MPGISVDSDVLDLALIPQSPLQSRFMPLSKPGTPKHARDLYRALPRE